MRYYTKNIFYNIDKFYDNFVSMTFFHTFRVSFSAREFW